MEDDRKQKIKKMEDDLKKIKMKTTYIFFFFKWKTTKQNGRRTNQPNWL